MVGGGRWRMEGRGEEEPLQGAGTGLSTATTLHHGLSD